MSERMNKRPISDVIVVTVQTLPLKQFIIARSKKSELLAMLQALQSHDKTGMVPADEVFKNIDEKYGKVGATIRGCRVRDGLTQEELACRLKIHQVHISQMEHGKRVVGKQMAHKLAKVFNTDYRLFL
jgi:ribosome-binding protein aMBF1 (putative translation factor)